MIDRPYTPHAWYWTVGGDTSRAWSSAARAYVTEYPADSAFEAATEADLREILANAGCADRAPGGLPLYLANKRWQVETGGCVTPAGVIATDRDSQAKLLAEMVAIGAGMRADPSPWKLRDGQFVSLSNTTMLAVIGAARSHIAASFAVECAVLAGIAAGTATDVAQIEAAAWPSNT